MTHSFKFPRSMLQQPCYCQKEDASVAANSEILIVLEISRAAQQLLNDKEEIQASSNMKLDPEIENNNDKTTTDQKKSNDSKNSMTKRNATSNNSSSIRCFNTDASCIIILFYFIYYLFHNL